MSRLLESIKFENGLLHNLQLHEKRMQHAVKSVFKKNRKFRLASEISLPKKLKKTRYKCRIVYDTEIRAVQFIPYKRKKINRYKLVVDEEISYPHKFEDRSCILQHSQQLHPGEELIIVKKGLLRDASYSNIALFDGEQWHTPAYPLLKGTKRAELIEKKILLTKMIRPHDLKNYERISFINALNDLDELNVSV